MVRRPLLPLVALSAAIVECVAALTGGPRPSVAIVCHPFAAITVASVFCRYIVYDAGSHSRKTVVYLTPLAVAAAVVAQRLDVRSPLPMLLMLCGLGVLGVFGFLLAAWRAADAAERSSYLVQLTDSLVLPIAGSMLAFGLWSTYHVNPVYDLRMQAFDAVLGADFSLIAARTYPLLFPLSGVATACYVTLPIAITMIAAAQTDSRRQSDVLTASIAAGACGFALYFVCPSVGTHNAFVAPPPSLPASVPTAVLLFTAIADVSRNAMPSLHAVWALLLWFNAEPLAVRWRRALRVFAVMNIWAAMGPGEHWMMDLVVAVPIAVAIQLTFVDRPFALRRLVDVASCVALAAMWLIGFRLGAPLLSVPAGVAWMMAAATVCWPLSCLARAPRIHVLRTGAASHPRSAARPWATSLAQTHSE
jgi:hypothetical protein